MPFVHQAISLLLLIWSLQAAGASTWPIGSDIFARLFWLSSLKIGDYLYLDGGFYDTSDNGVYSDLNILNDTLSLNLSKSWEISDVSFSSFSKPSNYFGTRSQAFWWDENTKTALAYGGEYYQHIDNISTFYLWELQPDDAGGGTWSVRSSSNDADWNQGAPGAYALAGQSNTTGYALGGFLQISGGSGYPSLSGLMAYEFETQTWSNITNRPDYYSRGQVSHGAAHFIPNVGSEGLILFFGGSANINNAWTPVPSSNITMYDPATRQWYYQQATGTPLPADRLDLCVVGVQESGAGSYEIYMWGGRNGTITTFQQPVADANDIFILTIPGFHWIKAGAEANSYRAAPTCQVVGNQLISVGGYNPDTNGKRTRDAWRYSIGVFDMTQLKWKTGFNHTAPPYIRPDAVNSYYAKNPSPPVWSFPGVQTAFRALDGSAAPSSQNDSSTPSETSNSTASIPTDGPSITADSPPNGSSTNVGPIAGGVVGCVGGVAALAGLWFLLRRRKQRQQTQTLSAETKQNYKQYHEQDPDSSVTVQQAKQDQGPWEMGGQYDRFEVEASYNQPHELEVNESQRFR